MTQLLAGPLVSRIQEALLADSPNAAGLVQLLSTECDLDSNAARSLLYDLTRELNTSVFPPITQVELIHTEGCNLACSYCFEKEMLGYKRMPIAITTAAIDLLFDYSGDETELVVTHFGGEPTLNLPGIRSATEYAERKAAAVGKTVRFDMTTNGVRLNEKMVDYFATHKIQVLVSIDGMKESHNRYRLNRAGRGSFDQVVQGLQLLRSRQAWIGVKITVMPDNASALFSDVRGLRDLGVNQFVIGHATGVEWSPAQMVEYGDQLARVMQWSRDADDETLRISGPENDDAAEPYFGCQAGRSTVAVSVHGEISPCSKIMGFGPSRQLVSKLGDVWHGMTHLQNRKRIIGCDEVEAACDDLGIIEEYRGGCFAVNLVETGDLFRPSLTEHQFSLIERSACAGCPASAH